MTASLSPEQRARALREFVCGLAQVHEPVVADAHFAVLTPSGDVTLRAHLSGRVDTTLAPAALYAALKAARAIEEK